MKDRCIKFSVKYDQKLIDNIEKHLKTGDVDSCTMLELSQTLGDEYKEGSIGWEKLRLHLIYMVRKEMVEERHFGKSAGDWDGKVDYIPSKPVVGRSH